MKFLGLFWLSLCLCVSAVKMSAQGLPVAEPQTVGMNAAKLNQIDAMVEADIAAKKLPGAVVLVGHKGKIVFRKAYGNRSLVPNVEPMTVDTIFDLASLTKPIATATSIMILVEQGKLRLSDTIGMYIPDIDDANAKKVTILQLLTHTSGYRPDFDLGEKWTGREGMLGALKKEKLRNPPGTKFVYSDIGFIVLGEIVHRVSSESLEAFVNWNIARPLGLASTILVNSKRQSELLVHGLTTNNLLSCQPLYEIELMGWKSKLDRVTPTENIKGQNSYLGGTFDGDDKSGAHILRGEVHDPTAFRMGGIAGHAGLFSTADDLARYCQMLLNGGVAPEGVNPSGSEGVLAGKVKSRGTKNTLPTGRVSASAPRRVLSAQTVALMTRPVVVSEDGATRGLGWDINTSFSANRGELFPLGSFGHTGFTGTGVWIDRVSGTFVVFLSNRVHPDGKGDVGPLRAKIATVVASAVEDTPIEKWKAAEAEYNATVAAQTAAFVERKKQLSAISSQLSVTPKNVTVANGIDVLEKSGFKELKGLKIGLVTNHTGRNLAGKQTIDILKESPNVNLVALFSPEHGIRGELDTEKIDDSKDEKTGLPVYSLYKDGMRRPKPEQTATIDAFVYDIQDIGARFYTYTATLKNVLEEAAKAGKPVFILDRPNPINGNDIDGILANEDKLSFIAAHTTPVRYGLTIGELGMMMNAERKIGADVRVVKMEGWSRSMWFDETGQTWVNPSPNMRSLTEATLYPGIGLLETTNVSVGRGTDTPFEVVGAPWINGRNLAKFLNERDLKGVRFVPIRFKPNASVFKDEECSGINIIITDRNAFDSVGTGIEIATALRKIYATDWQIDRYGRLLVNQEILDAVKRGETLENIDKLVRPKKEEFNTRRASYLLYK